MGTWSHEVFGNDSACDWAAGLAEGEGLGPIEAAIAAVMDAPAGLLDASLAEEALAAAEVLARLRGHAGERSAYTEALDAWVQRTRLEPPPALVQQALAALQRIGDADSELRESWAEADQEAAWQATLADLRRRLDAAPQAVAPPVALDPVAGLVKRVQALRFELLPLESCTTVNALYQQAVGAAALGDNATVGAALRRLWQPVVQLDKPSIPWDLAVRDAQTLAAEGRLDEALAGLEAWRGAPGAQAPGMFAMRAAGVCLSGGDLQRMAQLRDQASAEAPEQALWRLDRPLHEARAGSAEAAQALIDAEGDPGSDPVAGPVHAFVRGVLACRRADPTALALLTPVADDYAGKCPGSAAGWSLASAAIGWWALALAQAGRADEARAVAQALRPVLLQPHNELLVNELRAAGVLPAETAVPRRPVPQPFAGPAVADHGAFRSMALRGVNALRWVQAQRCRFAEGAGPYPFLIGDDEDLRRLLEMIAPPDDGGRAWLEAAAAVDLPAWLKRHASQRRLAWPRKAPAPQRTPLTQFDAATQWLKPVLHVGLADVAEPCELFARLGWGDWNACPPPHLLVALHRHWRKTHGAEPVALSGDVVECEVNRPPTQRGDALALAREHEACCPDIVEQGTGTTALLGASLLGAPYWYFWWD